MCASRDTSSGPTSERLCNITHWGPPEPVGEHSTVKPGTQQFFFSRLKPSFSGKLGEGWNSRLLRQDVYREVKYSICCRDAPWDRK